MRKPIVVGLIALGFASTAEASHRNMSFGEAKQYVRASMSIGFGNSWEYGYNRKIAGCRRITKSRVRCNVSWDLGDTYFKGRDTVWLQGDGWRDDFLIKQTNSYCIATGGSNCIKYWVEN